MYTRKRIFGKNNKKIPTEPYMHFDTLVPYTCGSVYSYWKFTEEDEPEEGACRGGLYCQQLYIYKPGFTYQLACNKKNLIYISKKTNPQRDL